MAFGESLAEPLDASEDALAGYDAGTKPEHKLPESSMRFLPLTTLQGRSAS